MAKVFFNSYKEACEFSKHVAITAVNTSAIHREGNIWWVEDQSNSRSGYDNEGFDSYGFDQSGYDRTGFHKDGYNRLGFDIDGYNENGFDENGFDRAGFNRDGLDSKEHIDNNEANDHVVFPLDGIEIPVLNRGKYEVGIHNNWGPVVLEHSQNNSENVNVFILKEDRVALCKLSFIDSLIQRNIFSEEDALKAIKAYLTLEERQIQKKHREFLSRIGKEYKGVRRNTDLKQSRSTHCWSCRHPLSNLIDLECVACDWILCGCGACGCNYIR